MESERVVRGFQGTRGLTVGPLARPGPTFLR